MALQLRRSLLPPIQSGDDLLIVHNDTHRRIGQTEMARQNVERDLPVLVVQPMHPVNDAVAGPRVLQEND